MIPRRRAAWRAYLIVSAEVLPGVRDMPCGDRRMALRFAALNAHLRDHAADWGVHAPKFLVVSARAWDMFRGGDRAGAAVLLRVLAGWLFKLSRGSAASTGSPG